MSKGSGRRSAPPAGGPPAVREALERAAEGALTVPSVAPAGALERAAEGAPTVPSAGLAEPRGVPGSSVVMLSAVCYSGPVVSLLLTRRE